MKKRLYLLIPIVALLALGLFMIPAKAATINDGQNDVIGIKSWEEGEELNLDCDWVPTDASMIDIQAITWVDAGPNYTITMTFYGNPNATLIADGDVSVSIMFLINGSTYPDDLETETPEAHLTLSSISGGVVIGNSTSIPIYDVMMVSGNSLIWSFVKTIEPVTPVALDSWDLLALVYYSYTEVVDEITYSYIAIDHYNFGYIAENLQAVCALLNLDIPGYSLIAVGIVAVITIGVIIKKKYKK